MKLSQRSKTRLFIFAVIVFASLAIFYLFALPALVATNTMEASSLSIAFAAFLYAQLWMLSTEYAYSAAAQLYGFRRAHLFPLPIKRDGAQAQGTTGFSVALFCVLSYVITIYGFAIAYTFVSHFDASAFTGGKIGIFDATYLSLVTASTTGFGDITPVSRLAKSLVMLEVLASLGYAVFFFSVLGATIRDSRR